MLLSLVETLAHCYLISLCCFLKPKGKMTLGLCLDAKWWFQPRLLMLSNFVNCQDTAWMANLYHFLSYRLSMIDPELPVLWVLSSLFVWDLFLIGYWCRPDQKDERERDQWRLLFELWSSILMNFIDLTSWKSVIRTWTGLQSRKFRTSVCSIRAGMEQWSLKTRMTRDKRNSTKEQINAQSSEFGTIGW